MTRHSHFAPSTVSWKEGRIRGKVYATTKHNRALWGSHRARLIVSDEEMQCRVVWSILVAGWLRQKWSPSNRPEAPSNRTACMTMHKPACTKPAWLTKKKTRGLVTVCYISVMRLIRVQNPRLCELNYGGPSTHCRTADKNQVAPLTTQYPSQTYALYHARIFSNIYTTVKRKKYNYHTCFTITRVRSMREKNTKIKNQYLYWINVEWT